MTFRMNSRGGREAGAVSVGLVLVLGGGVWIARPVEPPDRPTAIVEERPFVETIVEAGTISASRMFLYSSGLSGVQAKITAIAPEGTLAAAGDVLIQFDASGVQQILQKEEAALGQADAELVRAREDLRLERLRTQTDLDAVRQEITRARQELANELEGRGQLQRAEADATAAEAGREAERTRRAVDDLRSMLAEGFVTRAEVERGEQAWRRSLEQHRLAQLKLDVLAKYETPAALARLRAEVHAAEQEALRSAAGVGARLAQRQASLDLATNRVAEIRARLRVVRDQLERTTIRASGPGLVVHRDLFFGNDRRKPQIGDEVWPNQPLLALPDSNTLVVETRVREVDLHKVAASQHVGVSVDAYPALRLTGTVALVGAAAIDDAARGVKFFPVTIELVNRDPRLRVGMTARVDIDVSTLPAATVVPVDAVFDEGEGEFCLVRERHRTVRRGVRVIARTDRDAAVEGLAAGAVVVRGSMLAPGPGVPEL